MIGKLVDDLSTTSDPAMASHRYNKGLQLFKYLDK